MASTIPDAADKSSLTTDKYHMLLIYIIYEDGYYEGAYKDRSFKIIGGVGGQSFQEMYDEAYESLQECAVSEDYLPFDTNNVKESVVFDLVKCHTLDEWEKASKLNSEGKPYEEIKDSILG